MLKLNKILALMTLITFTLSTSVFAKAPNNDAMKMMSSTVRVDITVRYTTYTESEKDAATVTDTDTEEWTGSGVVYEKTDRKNGPIRSRILTADHVVDVPVVGTVEDDTVSFLGMEFSHGKRHVDSVKIEIQTADGRTCDDVKVLTRGSDETHDVAVIETACDAGLVAELATAVPVMGEKVFISGYPLGIELPVLTEGYVSGWVDGYLLTSAAAYGGNSGGPVFYDGKVVGLLVRGSREYPHLTLSVGIEECLRRISETPSL